MAGRGLPLWMRQQGLFFLAVLSAYVVNGMFHHIALIPMPNLLLFFAAGMNAAVWPVSENAEIMAARYRRLQIRGEILLHGRRRFVRIAMRTRVQVPSAEAVNYGNRRVKNGEKRSPSVSSGVQAIQEVAAFCYRRLGRVRAASARRQSSRDAKTACNWALKLSTGCKKLARATKRMFTAASRNMMPTRRARLLTFTSAGFSPVPRPSVGSSICRRRFSAG